VEKSSRTRETVFPGSDSSWIVPWKLLFLDRQMEFRQCGRSFRKNSPFA
jgi:hypothetical protein